MTGLDRKKDDEIIEVLRMMAPGTSLREGLDNILLARTGALIVIGDSEKVLSLVDGGFYITRTILRPIFMSWLKWTEL